MTTMDNPADVRSLRSRVRAAQRARSVPLIVVGILFVNYGVVQFAPRPVEWRYGAPLAFFLVWLLGRLTENRTGVGPGRADYLVAAGFVFTASSALMLRPFVDWIKNPARAEGIWVMIVAVALLALAVAAGDLALSVAGLLGIAVGLWVLSFGPHDDAFPSAQLFPSQETHYAVIAGFGILLVLAGLAFYQRERRAV